MRTSPTKIYEHLIIGAGLTGLMMAQKLQSRAYSVVLLEKSRGVGGRIATRRIDNEGFDHGAQFLEDPIPGFERDLIPSPLGHYREGGMNQLMKDLALDLEIHKEKRASILTSTEEGWIVTCDNGETFSAKKVTITAPVPQALDLLLANQLVEPQHPLFKIEYTKALLLLVVVKHLTLGTFSQDWQGHEIILMDERSLHPHGIILKLSDELSQELFELPDEQITQKMRALWNASPMGELEIEKFELKKWRYSRARRQFPQHFLEIQKDLFLAGDGFGPPLRSALTLAESL